MTTSRLDRLFLLLENGSSSVTRRAAATQLGHVQRLHPHELNNLLAKVRSYLHSNSWDTRLAAAAAVEAIVMNVPQWFPTGIQKDHKSIDIKQECTGDKFESSIDQSQEHFHLPSSVKQSISKVEDITKTDATRLRFSQFDINTVIKCGRDLLASEGSEFDPDANSQETLGMNFKEKLAWQRQQVNQRLGLELAEKMGIDTQDIVSCDDFVVNEEQKCDIEDKSSKNSTIVQDMISQATGRVFKRRNNIEKKTDSTENSLTKKIKSEPRSDLNESSTNSSIDMNQANGSNQNEWPLEYFCDELMMDLFSPSWEVRHGAATALREIIKHHGRCGGRSPKRLAFEQDILNQMWLEDVALRLLCVLALDKFGDYVSDQVVAPVRETCAQGLGSVLNVMTPERVENTLKILLQLLERSEWEARHGGLLGIKYLLAVRPDLTRNLLPIVIDPIFKGLQDQIDDVSAVAAAALIPVKDILIEILPEKVPLFVNYLWNALSDFDDLTSSTSNILLLLSSLLSYKDPRSRLTSSLSELVPRLWPFLSHTLASVRRSVLEALLVLTDENVGEWLNQSLMSDALRLLFQRSLVENQHEISELVYRVWQQIITKSPLETLLDASCQHVNPWICLMMHPTKVAIDSKSSPVWFEVRPRSQSLGSDSKGGSKSGSNRITDNDYLHHPENQYYIGGVESLSESSEEREKSVIRARLQAAKLIGLLACFVTKDLNGEIPSPLECFANILLFHLNSKSAIQRMCIAWVVIEWAKAIKWLHKKETDESNASKPTLALPNSVINKAMECLQEQVYYDEMTAMFGRLQHETRDFISLLNQHRIPLGEDNEFKTNSIFAPARIEHLLTVIYPQAAPLAKLKPKALEAVESRKRALMASCNEMTRLQDGLAVSVAASLACSLISWDYLPEKLNPVIRPLMDSIKREPNEALQKESAHHLIYLLDNCSDRHQTAVQKVIKNLISYLCSDPTFIPTGQSTPQPAPTPSQISLQLSKKVKASNGHSSSGSDSQSHSPATPSTPATPAVDQSHPLGIITLIKMQQRAEKSVLFRRTNSATAIKKISTSSSSDPTAISEDPNGGNDEQSNEILRRGSREALSFATRYFGARLPEKLSFLWEFVTTTVSEATTTNLDDDIEKVKQLIESLQTLEVIVYHIDSSLHKHLISLLPKICALLESRYPQVRHIASRNLGILSKVIRRETMDVILNQVIDMLGAADSDTKRMGAIEAVSFVIERLHIEIVPYIVLLIVPVLGRMSDQNKEVRTLATHCFAQLIQLMPLEGDSQTVNALLNPELAKRRESERHFVEQLIDNKKADDYKLPIQITAQLRSYQQEGVNWLAFLNRYSLHGILCDEMGLGKTLMTLCILASDHHTRIEKYKATKKADCKPLPSLVVCPPTLTGHWVYEVQKFVSKDQLKPLHYSGPPMERAKLRNKVKRGCSYDKAGSSYNLVIASYDIVRNDIDFFGSIIWNYCVLDEGHIIKNGKTKLAKAIKSLQANHRLILTGTPIQNNVLELWSLFDFLMPGFLGTEKQFMARYSRPILLSRDAKSNSREQQAGVLAMEALHRQVLPFILRRMKEDVLQDLPPKIIQDYYCELSPLQAQLYEDFSRSNAKKNLEESIIAKSTTLDKHMNVDANAGETETNIMSTHIFQALQYLCKVCNHPKLVLTPSHPKSEEVLEQLRKQNSGLNDIQHAAKLCSLRQLLLDCGIGTQSDTQASLNSLASESESMIVNQHRALIFCQLKSMLDIVENDLLRAHMPSVTYLRLDGSVPPGKRHDFVHRFNNDPSIDVLLLTTQVGGLGLNLTGADTVIFVEHDWNPSRDLQAMDRAHRIGQKKVVNVYRLITSGTLEEKIMGLQKFKLAIANTVISQENASLQTMATHQVLDLFNLSSGHSGVGHEDAKESGTSSGSTRRSSNQSGMKSVLENLSELWDPKEYETEYDLGNFIQSLKTE